MTAADDYGVQWTAMRSRWNAGVMQLEIHGRRLPGRSWPGRDGNDDLHVGLQVRRDPADLVPADAADTSWRTEIDTVDRDGVPDFRGPAVQGKRGERFVYLVWVNLGPDGSSTLLGRAKLMLQDVLAGAPGADGRVIVEVELTDESGRPRCARLPEPALTIHYD